MELLLIRRETARFLPLILTAIVLCGAFFSCSNQEEAFQKALSAEGQGDYTTALKYYGPLAEKGNALAQRNLALMYAQGRGVEKNYGMAFEWMKKSAENGNGLAQWMVAYMFLTGEGVEKNEVGVLEWARKAAAQNIDEAKRLLKYYEEHHQLPSPWEAW